MRDVISDHVRIMGRDAPTASEGPSGERAAISAVVQNCFAGNCFGHNSRGKGKGGASAIAVRRMSEIGDVDVDVDVDAVGAKSATATGCCQ
jgi:hypothetical protein